MVQVSTQAMMRSHNQASRTPQDEAFEKASMTIQRHKRSVATQLFALPHARQNAGPRLKCPIPPWSHLGDTASIFFSVGSAHLVIFGRLASSWFGKGPDCVIVSLYGCGRVRASPDEEGLCHLVCGPGPSQNTHELCPMNQNLPANCRARHGGDDSRLQSTEVSPVPFSLVNNLRSLDQA